MAGDPYDTMRPALARAFPPVKEDTDFNVYAAAKALAGETTRTYETEKRNLYKLRDGKPASGPFVRDLAKLLDVEAPKPKRAESMAELRQHVIDLETKIAELEEALEELRASLPPQARTQRRRQSQ